jgi:hypothetical protein
MRRDAWLIRSKQSRWRRQAKDRFLGCAGQSVRSFGSRRTTTRGSYFRAWQQSQDALKATATSSEDQVNNHNRDNEGETAAAVVAYAGTHVVSATAEYQQQNDEKNDEHARKSNMTVPVLGRIAPAAASNERGKLLCRGSYI